MKNGFVSNVLITAFGKFAVIFIQFVTTIILARLLTPADFGVVAMCTIFLNISTMLVDSGMAGSIIYYKDTKDIDNHTIFWFNLFVSIVLYIVLACCSGLIADFYGSPILKIIIRVSGLSIVIHSICIIQFTLLTKDLQFKIQTKILIISSVLTTILVILLAINGYGIWALVAQQVVLNIIQAILYIYYGKYRPQLQFSVACLKKHWNFGSKLLFVSFLKLIYDNMYVQTIGKVVTLTDAGYYNQAKKFNDVPMNVMSYPLERVVFPTLAHSRNFIDNSMKCVQYFSFIVIPLLVLGSLLASDLILLILGEKWVNSGWMLSFMLFGTIGALLENLNRSFIKATGRTEILLKTDTVKRLLNFLVLFISLSWGVKGILVAFIINGFLGWIFNSFALSKIANSGVWKLLKPSFLAIFYSLIPYVCIHSFSIKFDLSLINSILLDSVIFMMIYVLCICLLQKKWVVEVVQMILNKYRKNEE